MPKPIFLGEKYENTSEFLPSILGVKSVLLYAGQSKLACYKLTFIMALQRMKSDIMIQSMNIVNYDHVFLWNAIRFGSIFLALGISVFYQLYGQHSNTSILLQFASHDVTHIAAVHT